MPCSSHLCSHRHTQLPCIWLSIKHNIQNWSNFHYARSTAPYDVDSQYIRKPLHRICFRVYDFKELLSPSSSVFISTWLRWKAQYCANCQASIMPTLATRFRWAFSDVQLCFFMSVRISSVPVVGRNSYVWILPGLDCANAVPRLWLPSPYALWVLSHLLCCDETVVSVSWHNGLNQGIIMFSSLSRLTFSSSYTSSRSSCPNWGRTKWDILTTSSGGCPTVKGLVHPKPKCLASFIHPHFKPVWVSFVYSETQDV